MGADQQARVRVQLLRKGGRDYDDLQQESSSRSIRCGSPAQGRRLFFKSVAAAVGGYFFLPAQQAKAVASHHRHGEECHLHSAAGCAQPHRYVRSEGRPVDTVLHGPHQLRLPAFSAGPDAEPGEHHSGPRVPALVAVPQHSASAGTGMASDGTQSRAGPEHHRAAYRFGSGIGIGHLRWQSCRLLFL